MDSGSGFFESGSVLKYYQNESLDFAVKDLAQSDFDSGSYMLDFISPYGGKKLIEVTIIEDEPEKPKKSKKIKQKNPLLTPRPTTPRLPPAQPFLYKPAPCTQQKEYTPTPQPTRDCNYLSEVEEMILKSKNPIQLNETTPASANGLTGLFINKAEVSKWQQQAQIPIEKYPINVDNCPEVVSKKVEGCVQATQEVAHKYLKPPTVTAQVGDLIINKGKNVQPPLAPPLIIRQQPAKPQQPCDIIIREMPPKVPSPIPAQTINIPGSVLPPIPRKLVIEKMPQLPPPPPRLIVERWLDYPERTRNVVVHQEKTENVCTQLPRNIIVQWETPCQEVKQEFKFLGVEQVDPSEYVMKYGGKLTPAAELPKFVSEFKPVQGERLAASSRGHSVPRLVGAVQALSGIDLDKFNLAQYRNQVAVGGAVERLAPINEDAQARDYIYKESRSLYGSVGQDLNTRASPVIHQVFGASSLMQGSSVEGSSSFNIHQSAELSSAPQYSSFQDAGSSNFTYGSY